MKQKLQYRTEYWQIGLEDITNIIEKTMHFQTNLVCKRKAPSVFFFVVVTLIFMIKSRQLWPIISLDIQWYMLKN